MDQRITGKQASGAFKEGNNAGMNYKKDTKKTKTLLKTAPKQAVRHHTRALTKLRVAERGLKGDNLRSYTE
jgi:hypothetical protein